MASAEGSTASVGTFYSGMLTISVITWSKIKLEAGSWGEFGAAVSVGFWGQVNRRCRDAHGELTHFLTSSEFCLIFEKMKVLCFMTLKPQWSVWACGLPTGVVTVQVFHESTVIIVAKINLYHSFIILFQMMHCIVKPMGNRM